MGLNLGDFGNQLTLEEQNQATSAVANYGQIQPTDQAVSQQAQQPSGWAQTQQYMGLANSLGNDEEQQNGLNKVLGLVGAFV